VNSDALELNSTTIHFQFSPEAAQSIRQEGARRIPLF